MNSVKPDGLNLLSVRWLALGAAAGASLALVINQLGVQGPWQIIALVRNEKFYFFGRKRENLVLPPP